MRSSIVFIFYLLVFGMPSLYAQTVNDIPIEDIEAEYIQIIGTTRFMSNKVNIDIDFGQENKIWNANNTRITDEDGRRVIFNSMIDALNFMHKNGYEFVNSHVITIDKECEYHYLLRRKKSKQGE